MKRIIFVAIVLGLAVLAVPSVMANNDQGPKVAFGQHVKTKTTVTYPSAYAISPPLSELPIDSMGGAGREVPGPLPPPLMMRGIVGLTEADPVLQTEVLPSVAATKGVDFDGLSDSRWAPSDTTIAIGPNHIVQTVASKVAVFNKLGTWLAGPTDLSTVFFGLLGGSCATYALEPVANYDRMADRWVISALGTNLAGSYARCIGVSKTNDPTGAYWLYVYLPGTDQYDLGKVGVWPTASNSAYLATYNIWQSGQTFIGAALCGFDRTKMLKGDPKAAQLCQMTPNNEGGYLPSDMDGPTPPTDGTPGLFLTWQNDNPGQLYLRKLTLNFTAGTASLSDPTFINVANSDFACGNGGTCVSQKGTSQQLDSDGWETMPRMAYRKFPDHERVVVNHSVANGSSVAVRWYEILDPSGSVTLNQQGTFAPDATYRWMASAAMDKAGDIAIGYSASSSAIYPAIRFTGRVPSDPLGQLETEASILEGTGSQTGQSRWGDYTALQVDPVDDCTFWYTNQYEKVNGQWNWSTHIGSFAFTACGGGGGSVVTLSPTSLTFLNTVVGVTSAAKTVTVTNTGTATLNFTSITESGSDFHISSKTCGATLAAGASCKVKVTFTPTQIGLRTGSLTFADNAPDSPQTVPLSGTGTPQATLTPAKATFPATVVGATSQPKVFTLSNKQKVTLNNIVLSTTGDFSVSATTCAATLAAKTTCTINVVFKPTATGTRTGTLSVADSATNSPQTSSLKGTGK